MKRSEMVKFITTELFYGSLSARVDSDDVMITELAEKDAQAVLKLVEKLGMLPPMSDETMSSNPFHVADSILESVAHDFKWETENETK
jgi:hypothetical protein